MCVCVCICVCAYVCVCILCVCTCVCVCVRARLCIRVCKVVSCRTPQGYEFCVSFWVGCVLMGS